MLSVFHLISALYIATIVAERNGKSSEVLGNECSTQGSEQLFGFPAHPPKEDDVIKKSFARIKIVKARNLQASDTFLEGESSDPFVELKTDSHIKVRYGQQKQTHVVIQNLNPEWNTNLDVEFDYRCPEFKFKVI
eukprot:TRINITY_DN8251_c0_g1_i3.p2 TRINITY_DN8251_c0_g1~~TRINITY_DN8251_c0_g1_i3.p2  ORF type:complete len:135 (+),score=7.08 TRINITY_DN8251_c0_g1_i3:82-486(+)